MQFEKPTAQFKKAFGILTIAYLFVFVFAPIVRADVESGPSVDEKAPELKISSVVGDKEGEDVEFIKHREKKPTIYFFVRTDRFSRPLARVLKEVDTELGKTEGTAAVAVWLTEDAAKTKEHLPKIQQSLKFDNTTLACYEKKQEGPENWGINPDADLTVVVVKDGKVQKRFGFIGPNEKVTKTIINIIAGKKAEEKTEQKKENKKEESKAETKEEKKTEKK